MMMIELLPVVKGKQNFMGKDIPIVEGGFGEGKRCISDKTVAQIHDMKAIHVRETIGKNIDRFRENIDVLDLRTLIDRTDTSAEIKNLQNLLYSLGYTDNEIFQVKHIYLLSERGYLKLVKIMNTNLAWEIYENLIDEYFTMKVQLENSNNNLSVIIAEGFEKINNTINTLSTSIISLTDAISKNQNAESHNLVLAEDIETENFIPTVIASEYNKSARWLNQKLKKYGIQHLVDGKWRLTPEYEDKGLAFVHYGRNGSGVQYDHMYWTAKGKRFINDLLYEKENLEPMKQMSFRKTV